jgi:hypothetical protein
MNVERPAHGHSSAATAPKLWLGVVLMVANESKRVIWLGALGFMMFHGYWVARRYEATPPSNGDIVQCESDGSLRWCDVCEQYRGGRTFHCSLTGRCLSEFDHVCKWWGGPVWRNNRKANLHFIFFLILDIIFCIAVIVWYFKTKMWHEEYGVVLLCLPLPCIFTAIDLFLDAWRYIVKNKLKVEVAKKNIYLTVYSPGRWNGVYHWVVAKDNNKDNPWDLGCWGNLRLLLGGGLSWLFFWTPSPITKSGPVSNGRIEASSPAEEVDRRRAMVSTGAEEIELEGISVTHRHLGNPYTTMVLQPLRLDSTSRGR